MSFSHTKKDKICENCKVLTRTMSKSSWVWRANLKLGIKTLWAEWCSWCFLTTDLFMWKYINITTHNSSGTQYYLSKKIPTQVFYVWSVKSSSANQTSCPYKGPDKDHVWFFGGLESLTCWWMYQSLNPAECMVQTWNPKTDALPFVFSEGSSFSKAEVWLA